MKNKTLCEWDFYDFTQAFIDKICGDTDEPENLSRKIFDKAFRDFTRDIGSLCDDIQSEVERNLSHFKEHLAKELSEEFSKMIWRKFEEGHDIYEGERVVCFFKKENKYSIGEAICPGEGISFKLENGEIRDPDYICPLYLFEE